MQQFDSEVLALADASADNCGWDEPKSSTFTGDTTKLEDDLFDKADGVILEALNTPGAEPAKAISEALETMRAYGDHAGRAWPEDRRFHYELLAIQPAFVVSYHVRSRSTWSVFAIPEEATWPKRGKNAEWQRVGEDDSRWQEPKGDQHVELHSIMRGPSHRARFLSRSSEISCGDGITGLAWKAYEWDGRDTGSLSDNYRTRRCREPGRFRSICPNWETPNRRIENHIALL
jgi:hypothetical protein